MIQFLKNSVGMKLFFIGPCSSFLKTSITRKPKDLTSVSPSASMPVLGGSHSKILFKYTGQVLRVTESGQLRNGFKSKVSIFQELLHMIQSKPLDLLLGRAAQQVDKAPLQSAA